MHLDFGLFLSKNRSKCAIFEDCKNLCDSVRQTKFALSNNKKFNFMREYRLPKTVLF